MKHFANDLRDRLSRRSTYRKTVRTLRALPLDTKLDLGISGIEDTVARNAVYG